MDDTLARLLMRCPHDGGGGGGGGGSARVRLFRREARKLARVARDDAPEDVDLEEALAVYARPGGNPERRRSASRPRAPAAAAACLLYTSPSPRD